MDGNLPVDSLGIGQVVLVRFLIPDRLDLPLGLDGAVVLSESKRTELSAAAAKERLQLAGRRILDIRDRLVARSDESLLRHLPDAP